MTPDAREVEERFGSQWAGIGRVGGFLKEISCLLEVTCAQAASGGRDAASVEVGRFGRRRQRNRALGKLGGFVRGSSPRCMRRGRVERSCDFLVRALSRDREVPCAFLRVDVEARQAFVHAASSMQWHRLVAGGGE